MRQRAPIACGMRSVIVRIGRNAEESRSIDATCERVDERLVVSCTMKLRSLYCTEMSRSALRMPNTLFHWKVAR